MNKEALSLIEKSIRLNSSRLEKQALSLRGAVDGLRTVTQLNPTLQGANRIIDMGKNVISPNKINDRYSPGMLNPVNAVFGESAARAVNTAHHVVTDPVGYAGSALDNISKTLGKADFSSLSPMTNALGTAQRPTSIKQTLGNTAFAAPAQNRAETISPVKQASSAFFDKLASYKAE